MDVPALRFSIAAQAAWAPGLSTASAWQAWAAQPAPIESAGLDPALARMPAMLRRRAGFLGKMALQVAYDCLGERSAVPAVFCSRHGEVGRAVDLLGELARGEALSPTGFGLAVHNASAGLFSIARSDRANHLALAGGAATIEHGVIEACALLADGAPQVLLVAYDCPLPPALAGFQDCREQAHAWAWLLSAPAADPISLRWRSASQQECDAAAVAAASADAQPGGLEILRFQLSGARALTRSAARRTWTWTRDAAHA